MTTVKASLLSHALNLYQMADLHRPVTIITTLLVTIVWHRRAYNNLLHTNISTGLWIKQPETNLFVCLASQ